MNDKTIKLRKRKMSSGNTSLYLAVNINGQREYEYLKLYLVPEVTKADKENNRQTMRMAEAILAKRTVELVNGEYGFKKEYKTETLFFPYYEKMCEERHGSKGNWGNWYSCLHHLRIYEKRNNITFAEITPEWVKGFRDYLEHKAIAWISDKCERVKDQKLARNSKVSYFAKVRACLNQAFDERIIPTNPCRGIENFKAEEGTRMYLTVEELKRLVDTPCEYSGVKTTFLFSCLTGLRRSDILKLTWGEVHQQGDFTRLIFKQKKTGGQEYLDINKQAADLQNKEKEFKKEINNVKNDLEAFRQYGYAITDFCQVYTKLEPIKENYTDTYCKLLNAFRCFAKSNEKAIWYAPACIDNLKESLKKVHELKELFTEEHEIKISKYIDEIMSISKSELSQYKTEIIKIEEDRKKYKNKSNK